MPNLSAAIQQGIDICWDEGYGYNLGGMARSYAEGVDCSGFIGRCLSDAGGFNYPSYHVGTINMKTPLQTAGFIIIPVTSLSQMPNPGDIVVMNHLDLTGGHTFFYMEDIQAYTDPNAYSDNVGLVHNVKVEASSTRGHTTQGDHRRDGTGAYWEVWVHAYHSLYTEYDPDDPNDEIYIARWPGGLSIDDLLLWKRIRDIQFRRKYNVL